MALAPVITIIIHVGDVYYTDRSRTTRNIDSFNTALSVVTYGESTQSVPHTGPPTENIHMDTLASGHSHGLATQSTEVAQSRVDQKSAEMSTIDGGHSYFPPTTIGTRDRTEVTGKTKASWKTSSTMKDWWKYIDDIVGRLRDWLLKICNWRS